MTGWEPTEVGLSVTKFVGEHGRKGGVTGPVGSLKRLAAIKEGRGDLGSGVTELVGTCAEPGKFLGCQSQ